jgi:co-chaperonin GroES (HSP10)
MNDSILSYSSLEEAFPVVDPEYTPSGHFVLFQLRTPKEKSVGGIIVPDSLRDDLQWTTQVAKVVALGPVAFKSRDTLEPWPEGSWGKVGDFVRVPAFGGDRWFVPVPGSKMKAMFAQFRDLDLKGQFLGDPLTVDTY